MMSIEELEELFAKINGSYDRMEAMMSKSLARMDSGIQEYETVGSIRTTEFEEIKRDIEVKAYHLFDEIPHSHLRGFQHESHESATDKLAMEVCGRFGDKSFHKTMEEFTKIMQTGTVDEYQQRFEELKAMVMSGLPQMQESYYIAIFISGLKEEIKSMVKLVDPKTLIKAMQTAKLQEKSVNALQKYQNRNGERSVTSTNAMVRSPGKVVDLFAEIGESGIGPVLGPGTDLENSEDQSNKSSTAASAPKMRNEIPDPTGSTRDKFRIGEVYSKANETVTDKVVTDKVAIRVEKVKELGSSVGIGLKSYKSEDVFFSNTVEEFSDSEVSPRIDEYLDSVDQPDENMKEDLISNELTGLTDYETRMKDESKKALENVENKNQIVECNSSPALILKLHSEDVAIHYEAVGVIENLVLSSLNIKREVLLAGALQYDIGLLSSCCLERQRGTALLLGQFAATNSDYKVHIVQRGCVKPLIEMLQFSYPQLREMSAFGLQRLA